MKPIILGLGGTPRPGSTSERALALSLQAAAEEGAETLLISGADLMLPMYFPSTAERTPEAQHLIQAFRRCHGIIISTPAYHGSLSGLIKNALDYSEDLRTDPRVYFDGLAVGCIVCAGGWQAAGQTLAALRDRPCVAWLANAARRHAQHVHQAVRRRWSLPRPFSEIPATALASQRADRLSNYSTSCRH
jgi:NAD(P)H-dependent FMN reductase